MPRSSALIPGLLLFLGACGIDQGINSKDKDPGGFDTGDTDPFDTDTDTITPPEEDCNGVDDDGDGSVDEDFPDADENGRADCMDVDCPDLDTRVGGEIPMLEECVGTSSGGVVKDPWNVVIEFQDMIGGSGTIMMPAVGNLSDDNGDGQIDEDDVPDIAFTSWSGSELIVASGDGSGELWRASNFDGNGGVTIADVDNDGFPDVVGNTPSKQAICVNNDGTEKWVSSAGAMQMYPQPAVADLDEDGDVEVVVDNLIVEGSDGSVIANLTGLTTSWRTPVLADIDQDGTQEVILGERVYAPDGTLLWTTPTSGWSNFAAVADVDGDPGGEVWFASGSNLYLYDSDGTLLSNTVTPGANSGPPCVADFDGDGQVEIALPAQTLISVVEFDGTVNWSQPIDDGSGIAGCSGYDIDGNGAYELLYADQQDFFIYDGTTGTVLFTDPSHNSGTLWEYPVTADVDNDGSAEIAITSNGGTYLGLTVFGHAGDGWAASGPTWGTHDFAVTNLNQDGSVPTVPDPSWQVYNVFRARPQVDDPSNADLFVRITDVCVADCTYGPAEVSIQVGNQGGAASAVGTPVYLYADDSTGPTLLANIALPEILPGVLLDGVTVEVDATLVGDRGFYAVVDPIGVVGECDEGNNRDAWVDAFCD